jgi:hypothetical protein
MTEMYEYSGYVTFAPLLDADLRKVQQLAAQSGLEVDIGETWMEFAYAGRDTNRKVLTLLRSLASILRNAEGEIVCEVAPEEGDPAFEFYTVRDGALYVQKGYIVREALKQKS